MNTPDQNLYKPLYKGQIYWVFENNPAQPFEGWTSEIGVLLWHREAKCLIAGGNYQEDKSIKGCILWGQGVDFIAIDPKHMVECTKSIAKWYR